MPHKIRSAQLETRTGRLKLAPRARVYAVKIAPGIRLGYRAGPGTWSVDVADGKGGKQLKSLQAIADDHEDSDAESVLTFWEAIDKARALARGHEQHGRPGTTEEALANYEHELRARNAHVVNATRVRRHLTPQLLTKPLGLLTAKILWRWRGDLLGAGMTASTFTRMSKAFKSALNLAADHDPRLDSMRAEWRKGLAAIHNEEEETDCNVVLSPTQEHDVIAACYDVSPALGLYVETVSTTGSRPSQIALVDVRDLQTGAAPTLLVPTSLKGKKRTSTKRTTRIRKPTPIPMQLAAKLAVAAAGRPANAPLLPDPDGGRWRSGAHYRPFARAAAVAGLPDASLYSMRHTRITRMLLAGIPIRTVAALVDSSVATIEKTYSRHIGLHSDAIIRAALFKDDAPAAPEGNVVSLRR